MPRTVFDAGDPATQLALTREELQRTASELAVARAAIESLIAQHAVELAIARAEAAGRRNQYIREQSGKIMAGLVRDAAVLMAQNLEQRRKYVLEALAWARLLDEELAAAEAAQQISEPPDGEPGLPTT